MIWGYHYFWKHPYIYIYRYYHIVFKGADTYNLLPLNPTRDCDFSGVLDLCRRSALRWKTIAHGLVWYHWPSFLLAHDVAYFFGNGQWVVEIKSNTSSSNGNSNNNNNNNNNNNSNNPNHYDNHNHSQNHNHNPNNSSSNNNNNNNSSSNNTNNSNNNNNNNNSNNSNNRTTATTAAAAKTWKTTALTCVLSSRCLFGSKQEIFCIASLWGLKV